MPSKSDIYKTLDVNREELEIIFTEVEKISEEYKSIVFNLKSNSNLSYNDFKEYRTLLTELKKRMEMTHINIKTEFKSKLDAIEEKRLQEKQIKQEAKEEKNKIKKKKRRFEHYVKQKKEESLMVCQYSSDKNKRTLDYLKRKRGRDKYD